MLMGLFLFTFAAKSMQPFTKVKQLRLSTLGGLENIYSISLRRRRTLDQVTRCNSTKSQTRGLHPLPLVLRIPLDANMHPLEQGSGQSEYATVQLRARVMGIRGSVK